MIKIYRINRRQTKLHLMARGAAIMHPEIAMTLAEQRRQELVRHTAASRRDPEGSAGSRRLSRLPRWHVTWSRTVLSPAGVPGTASSSRPDRPGQRGSSLVIIISAHRSA
jgi:hypothetical protein